MPQRQRLKDAVGSSKYKKWFFAEQLGIEPSSFSRILSNPQSLLRDKLKLSKVLELLDCTVDEIDFMN